MIGHVKEDEETFVVRRKSFVRVKLCTRLSHCLQVQHVNADLLSNGWRIEWVRDGVALWPCTTVDVQKSVNT